MLPTSCSFFCSFFFFLLFFLFCFFFFPRFLFFFFRLKNIFLPLLSFFCFLFFVLLMKLHLCFVSFNNSFVVLLERQLSHSQIVYSPPQLRNSCSTNVSSEVWCFCTAHSLYPIQTRSVLTREPSTFVAWLKANRIQTVCTVVFQRSPDFESCWIDRNGCRHQRLAVRTLQNIVFDTEQFGRSRAVARVQ